MTADLRQLADKLEDLVEWEVTVVLNGWGGNYLRFGKWLLCSNSFNGWNLMLINRNVPSRVVGDYDSSAEEIARRIAWEAERWEQV